MLYELAERVGGTGQGLIKRQTTLSD